MFDLLDINVKSIEHLQSLKCGHDALPEGKTFISTSEDMESSIRNNSYVEVAEDFSPKMNRPKGKGYVISSHYLNNQQLFNVKYEEVWGNMLHKNIYMNDITVLSVGHEFNRESIAKSREKRSNEPPTFLDTSPQPPKKEKRFLSGMVPYEKVIVQLKDGYSKNLKIGWMRDEVGLQSKGVCLNIEEKARLYAQVIHVRTHQKINGGPLQRERCLKSQEFKKRIGKWDPKTTAYLLEHAWGLGNNYLTRLEKEIRQNGRENGYNEEQLEILESYIPPKKMSTKVNLKVKSVIDHFKTAQTFFSAKRLYAINVCRQEKILDYDFGTRKEYMNKISKLMNDYEHLDLNLRDIWNLKRREHLAQQPFIKDMIVDSLFRKPQQSWRGIEGDINSWCSHMTIERFCKSFDTFGYYKERIIPLLSPLHKEKHLEFAKFVYERNWDLLDDNGKLPCGKNGILLIHYDEKWFWGLVLRAYAKECEELGLQKFDFKTFHRNHINKVMGIGFVAAYFDVTPESGCIVKKLPFIRAQGMKKAQREVRKSRILPDGSRKYDGNIIRKKGDTYWEDCCVTGSNDGTLSEPKCSLKKILKESIFPQTKKLVQKGGEFEYAQVIFQGDRAGPHEDGEFRKFVDEYCDEMGWKWYPQAPRMPHANVLDLSVFPAMSRRHCNLIRTTNGLRVASPDEIWKCSIDVWNKLPNEKIASAFVQYWRILGKVIKAKGGNEFVGSGGNMHCGVSNDFKATKNGLERIH